MNTRRTVLITGGSSGLGYRTAAEIARSDSDWDVVITGRGASVQTAADRLGNRVTGLRLDLAALEDVRRFVRAFPGENIPPLHAIVCNAGTQIVSGTTTTVDGFEQTFAVNHLAHFLLVRGLLPSMATPGRIVFVASDTHDPAKRTGMPAPVYTTARDLAYPDAGNSTDSPGQTGRRRYSTSKLCNVLTAYELSRRLGEGRPPITVNAFDPGLMPGTGLARDYPGIQGFAWHYLMPILTVVPIVNVHTPKQSAQALARLILEQSLADTTGRYFSGRRDVRSSADSYDLAKARDLWNTSAELVGVDEALR
jgi:NAD(P)-dependent dehydrogenase (short-subunit alcohol dehydrogenase family)